MGWLVWDTETASATELKSAGAWRYAECPTTQVISIRFRDHQGRREAWRPGMIIPRLWQDAVHLGWLIIAHNVAFEKAILRKILVPSFDWPDAPNAQWHDTMAACAMKALPLKLEKAAEVLNLPVVKDMEGSKLVRGLSTPNRKGWLPPITDSVLFCVDRYCGQDVDAEVELHTRLGELPADERRMWQYDQAMNERGLRLDLPFVDAAQIIVDKATGPLRDEFLRITGLEKFGSPKLLPWLHGQGVHLDNLQAETLDEFMADTTLSELNPAHRALSIRQLIGSSSIKKLKAMRSCVCWDGRARGLFQWHATVPGRGAGRLFQPQNFPRGTIEHDKSKPDPQLLVDMIMTGDPGMVELIGPAVEVVVSSLRHAVIADPGKVFISGDYAGIQARVVLALAGQHDKAMLMANGVDVYCDMASAIYKRLITRADKEERQTGKNSVLGLGFQMGWQKFWEKYCKKQSAEFAQKVVETYRTEWAPKVPELWRGLQRAATKTVWDGTPHEFNGIEYRIEDGWLTCRSPAGAKIWYRNPQKTRRPMPWDENDLRPGFSFESQKTGQWKTIHAFGGQLTENIVMRIEADIKNVGIHNLEQNGFPVVLDVHDELVCELANPDEKAFAQLMLDLPAWVKSCQIPVAIDKPWIDKRYRK